MLFSRVITTSLMISAIIGLSACNRTDQATRGRTREPVPGRAYVRYVNALTTNAGADLYLADARLPAATHQKDVTYTQVPAERLTLSLRHTDRDDAKPLTADSTALRPDAHYTVIAFDDENGRPTVHVINDEESAPASGKTKVRVIDAAARPGDFDLYVASSKLISEPLLGAISGWKQVDAVSEPLELRARNGRPDRIPVANDIRLHAGRLYTFVVADGRTPEQPLQVIALENEPTKLPVATPPNIPPSL